MKLEFIFRTVHPTYTFSKDRYCPLIRISDEKFFNYFYIIYSATPVTLKCAFKNWYNYEVKKL